MTGVRKQRHLPGTRLIATRDASGGAPGVQRGDLIGVGDDLVLGFGIGGRTRELGAVGTAPNSCRPKPPMAIVGFERFNARRPAARRSRRR
jgi:hypothetical protein